MSSDAAVQVCAVCNDTGWKPIDSNGERRVTRCDCRLKERGSSLLDAAKLPSRYKNCELANFITEFKDPSSTATSGGLVPDPSLSRARLIAGRFIEEYRPGSSGLLFIGPNGSGKTHLAVGVIRELIRSKGTPCIFVDFRELLREIRHSYNSTTQTTELDVLSPIFETPVLLLDDLGAFATTAWERDTISYILNKRYSDERTTIITTYLLDRPSPSFDSDPSGAGFSKAGRAAEEAKAAIRDRTLGERIGDQMRARLHEMCKKVEIQARDYRDRART